jgi:hypothetical protein
MHFKFAEYRLFPKSVMGVFDFTGVFTFTFNSEQKDFFEIYIGSINKQFRYLSISSTNTFKKSTAHIISPINDACHSLGYFAAPLNYQLTGMFYSFS